ncbi:MAG: hypothetical protein LBU00_00035, partial [Treponema sp.]|nr:hypothetical protein [Treponema sp.]
MTKPRFVLDTNAAIFLIAHKDIFPSVRQAVDDADVFVSVITRIELLAKPGIAPDELQAVVDFLAEVTVIPL